jgi:hypothetical protein
MLSVVLRLVAVQHLIFQTRLWIETSFYFIFSFLPSFFYPYFCLTFLYFCAAFVMGNVYRGFEVSTALFLRTWGLLICDAVLLDWCFLTFRKKLVPLSSTGHLKHRETQIQRHRVTSQKKWLLIRRTFHNKILFLYGRVILQKKKLHAFHL